MPKSHNRFGNEDEEYRNYEDYEDDGCPSPYVNERPPRQETGGPFYDVKHFCPSWGKCCRDNLRLKPYYLPIRERMSAWQAHRVFDAYNKVLNDTRQIYGMDWKEDMEVCAKDIVKTKENAEILIQAFATCKCCERHNTRKPLSLNDKSWERIEKGEFDTYNDRWCACPCRSNARLIQKFIKS